MIHYRPPSFLRHKARHDTGPPKYRGGQFPATQIASVLQYGSEIPSRGAAQTPVRGAVFWGPVFGRMNQSAPDERGLRVTNLSQFIKTIQVK
jgi:hypothetical protein